MRAEINDRPVEGGCGRAEGEEGLIRFRPGCHETERRARSIMSGEPSGRPGRLILSGTKQGTPEMLLERLARECAGAEQKHLVIRQAEHGRFQTEGRGSAVQDRYLIAEL